MCLLGYIKTLNVPREKPLHGWRGWDISNGKLEPRHRNRANFHNTINPWRNAKNICVADRKPTKSNKSGLYSYNTRWELINRYELGDVWGLIAIWGLVCVHYNGYRAQYAQIVKLEVENCEWNYRLDTWGDYDNLLKTVTNLNIPFKVVKL